MDGACTIHEESVNCIKRSSRNTRKEETSEDFDLELAITLEGLLKRCAYWGVVWTELDTDTVH
jgi:hypothetical protein